MTNRTLPNPPTGRAEAEVFVAEHLADLVGDEVRGSETFRGGQAEADAALAAFDVAGYAGARNEVWPAERRGASRLSPYIRHGLLPLPAVWNHVAGGPRRDVEKFRDELLWQEYARHWYARLGERTRAGVRHRLPGRAATTPIDGWPAGMACVDLVLDELHRDGWLVNQTRMWLAAHWSSREGVRWQDGEEHFFRHLLDGSRAANRLGWQWVTGTGSSKAYLFTRRQVERRAPDLCATCPLRTGCPIGAPPPEPRLEPAPRSEALRGDGDGDGDVAASAGPLSVDHRRRPDAVWLTAESLGDSDPALAAHADLPAVFVFDEALLARLRLSSKRLVFLVETLAGLAETRAVELVLGDPVDALRDRAVAVTFAPVPGFRSRAERISPAELHPWPWLRHPGAGPIQSFSAWRRSVDR